MKAEKVWFLRGLLVGVAMVGREVTYDQVRRLVRLSDRQVGEYLNAARQILLPGEPDVCASVVKTTGGVGKGFGPESQRVAELLKARAYWQDRAELDNADFVSAHQTLPSLPGKN
jgi:hypothetical protein